MTTTDEVRKELVSIRIPEKLNEQFTDYVKQKGLTKSAFLLNYIHQVLNENFSTKEIAID